MSIVKMKLRTLGYEFSINSFEDNGSALVELKCEKKLYQDTFLVEDDLCDFLSQKLPKGYKVQTHHVTLGKLSVMDSKGSYIESLVFHLKKLLMFLDSLVCLAKIQQ